MVKRNYEVIIIGGGPAGSSAAIYLARFGFDVCLIEKKIFPRETLCGEFLSGEVIKHLQNMGIDSQFLALSPNLIKSFKVFFENGKSFSGNFNFNAYAIKRSVFDQFMLQNAKLKGVEIFQPAEVKEIIKNNEIFTIKIKDQNSREIVLNSKILIAAYGKQNSLDSKLNRAFNRSKTGFNGIKFHIKKSCFNSFNKEEIHLYTGKDLYCGINSVDNNTMTLCFLQNRKNPISYKQHLLELFNSNPAFNRILKKNFFNSFSDHKVYGTGNIYFGRRNKVESGIIMIGDAAGMISPFSGDGIGMAFDSAKLASECLAYQRKTNRLIENAFSMYEKSWSKLFSKRIFISKFLQGFLLKSSLRKIASGNVHLLEFFPSLNSLLIKVTRT